MRVGVGHDAAHVGDADVVVYSSAAKGDNPEIVEAHRRRIPVIPRAEMLAELMRLRSGICIAGAHGKTTTTSMVALVLERAGLDPTAVIGGKLSAFGSNARLGRGEYMVAEADESDRSFLRLTPTVAVITNIDHEHLEAYRGFDDLCQAFLDFANKVPFYGAVVACVDDPHVRALVPRMTRRVITYGIEHEGADLRGLDVTHADGVWQCRVVAGPGLRDAVGLRDLPPSPLCTLRMPIPGRHNIQNALAAVAVGLELGIDLGAVTGGARRVQRRRPPVPAARRGQRRARHRRLRPPPDRDPGRARRGARLAGPAPRRGVPAAPLLAHRAAARPVRAGAGEGRRAGAHRHLPGRRSADSGHHRSTCSPAPSARTSTGACTW